MVLNDVFDVEIDQQQRPGRPLPAGQISIQTARTTGLALLAMGVVLAVAAGWIAGQDLPLNGIGPVFRTGAIAAMLALLIYLYDGPLKKNVCAPLLMGGCRSLNILLGASTFSGNAIAAGEPSSVTLVVGIPIIAWWVALAIGVLVAGTTLLGRHEASDRQNRISLVLAGIMIAGGLFAIALVVYAPSPFEITDQQKQVFPMFIGIFSLTIARRVVEAIITAKPKQIQRGVVSVLRSLIIFDASICYLTAPDQPIYALVVLALLIPTLLMARFIPST